MSGHAFYLPKVSLLLKVFLLQKASNTVLQKASQRASYIFDSRNFKILISLILISSLFACTPATTKDIKNYSRKGDLQTLSGITSSGNKQERLEAIRSLGNMRDPRAVNALRSVIENGSNWTEREAAVVSLEKINDLLSVSPLIIALKDEEKFVQARAAKALNRVAKSLGKKRNPRIITLLIEAQRVNHSFTRNKTAEALQLAIKKLSIIEEPDFLDEMIKALDDDNRYVRRLAAQSLGQFNDPRIIGPLLKLQTDGDPKLREISSIAIQKVDDPRSVQQFMLALSNSDELLREETISKLSEFTQPRDVAIIESGLKHEHPLVRAGAAESLGLITNPSSKDKLIHALEDNDSHVRKAAANALVAYKWEPANDEEKTKFCIAKQQWADCLLIGEIVIPHLVALMGDENTDVRQGASEVLTSLNWQPQTHRESSIDCVIKQDWPACVELGEPALDSLILELTDGNGQYRENIIDTLAKINHPRGIKPLLDMFKSSGTETRTSIVKAVGQFNHPLAIKQLLASLDDNNYYVREAAAASLELNISNFGNNDLYDTKKPLLKALNDNNRNVRIVAARLLGTLKDPATITNLITALKDNDSDVRNEASEALLNIKDSSAIGPLVNALQDPDSDVRKQVIMTLGGFQDHRTFEPTLKALNDPNMEVQVAAIVVLGKKNDVRTVDPLINKLKSSSTEVQLQTIVALSSKNNKKVINALLPFLAHKQAEIRDVTGQALIAFNWKPKTNLEKGQDCIIRNDWVLCEKLANKAVKPLILELQDPTSTKRVESARVLGFIRDVEAIKPLIETIELTQWTANDFNPEIIESSQRALIKFGRDALPEIINYLDDWYTGQHLAKVLEAMNWVPRTDRQVVYYQIAKRARKELESNWLSAKKILLADIKQGSEQAKNTALFTFVGIGKDEMLKPMLNVLNSKGSVTIAEAYLNSGHPQLQDAAENWTSDNNLEIKKYGKGLSPVLWGEM